MKQLNLRYVNDASDIHFKVPSLFSAMVFLFKANEYLCYFVINMKSETSINIQVHFSICSLDTIPDLEEWTSRAENCDSLSIPVSLSTSNNFVFLNRILCLPVRYLVIVSRSR